MVRLILILAVIFAILFLVRLFRGTPPGNR
jgi:hypothetical protein